VSQGTAPDLSPYALDLRPRRRPAFTVQAHLCTWDVVVLRVEPVGGGRTVFVAKGEDQLREFLKDLDDGRHDARLAAALHRPPVRRLHHPPSPPRGIRLGVEHEYVVHGPDGPIDFRKRVDELDLGIRADPTDPHAQRGSWGGVVTTDGAEAEVATPPVLLAPGGVADVVALAERGRRELARALGDDHRLEGYSTHLNISVPSRGDVSRATLFARTFAPSLMLLLDRSTSPGLLVRPRPHRLELGGEFADARTLEVALTFAAGAALASGGRGRREAQRLAVDLDLQPAVERFGWYVDRTSVGCDLYELGREAPLRRLRSGRTVTAGEHLLRTWEVARARLAGRVGDEELLRVDSVVLGSGALPRRQGVAS
jgi:hypothetical protein